MSSHMAVEAPTFYSLNKPQKRALMLRDRLRYTDTRHLDSFIAGLAESEPPNYKRINGTVYPPLVLVTLRPAASRYDLGNVHFDNNDHGPPGIYRAYLTVEDGSFELRTEDALPADEANLDSVAIHIFIAKTMVAMFETKFKAIWTRMKQINDIRQIAFDVAGKIHEEEEFRAGETLSRLDSERPTQNGSSSQAKKAKKRRPGEAIVKHSSNKRNRVGLDTIPQDAKTATFNAIPNQIKVDLFNNVVKTAFPNFDNLMMASWNVVSVYSNVGTDFPELHKSIVELKSVLQDFEESVGAKVARTEPKLRKDFAPPSQDREDGASGDRDAKGTLDPAQQDGTQDSPTAPEGGSDSTPQQQDDIDSLFEEPEPERDHLEMPPPRIMQMSQRHQNDEGEGDQRENRRSSAIPSTPRFTPDRASASPARTLTKRKRSPSTESTKSTSELRRRRDEYRTSTSSLDRLRSQPSSDLLNPSPQLPSNLLSNPFSDDEDQVPANKPTSLKEMSIPELRFKYKERKAQLLKTFGGNANVPQQYRMQMQDLGREIKEREAREKEREDDRAVGVGGGGDGSGTGGKGGGGGVIGNGGGKEMPKFLGNSVLGGKKTMGSAPVAPMVHTHTHMRRGSGGSDGGGGGGGGKRRG